MVGGIKAVSPWVKSASEKLLMGLPTVLTTVLAPSGEERTLEETAPCTGAHETKEHQLGSAS